MIVEKILEILQSRPPRTMSCEGFKPAAVLVPVQERFDSDYLILTQRAEMLNSHSGQVAFPGGRIDPRDSGPLAAALRESEEEIGIKPKHVRILGQLDQVTAASNYVVTPFVGLIPNPYEFRLNAAETTAVFAVPISALLDPGCFSLEPRRPVSTRRDPIYHFYYKGWDIWGATARIIVQLLELAYDFEVRKLLD
jgi:8-oxo-dGTP pyrophosphatase MutT (NUDIX family)